MCHPAVYYGAMVISAAMSAKAQYDQGQYERDVAEYNAAVDKNKATKVENRSRELETAERQKARELMSKQRTIAASRGVVVGSGTPGLIEEDTAMIGELNVRRIKDTTEQQVGALTSSAELTESAGEQAARQGSIKATSTAIGAAGKMAGGSMSTSGGGGTSVNPKWYMMNDTGTTSGVGNIA